MPKIRSKSFQEQNVLDAALERIRYCYLNFDKLVVSFSAGKDSTALLHLVHRVATELNRLPVHVIFVDEEAIHPPTIEYAERIRQNPDYQFDWYCLPVKHRNACSNDQPFWYSWDPYQSDKWVRPMPENVITDHPAFEFGMSFQEWMPKAYGPEYGKVCYLTGIRTQESLRRYRVIASKKNDAYLTTNAENKNTYRAFPIYDWTSEDVWRLVDKWNLDYNRTYDIFNKTEWHGRLLQQRVCPPFGEEPLRGLWVYAECFPDMWHKMLYRVPGVATAWRYANTELWSNWVKPEGKTWQQYFWILLDGYDAEHQNLIKKNINGLITQHNSKTRDTIQEDVPHPITGASWKFFCKVVQKGDFKGRQAQNMMGDGQKVRDRLGIDLPGAIERYGLKSKQLLNSYLADLLARGANLKEYATADESDESLLPGE